MIKKDIEAEIRKIQQDIIKVKKEKNMIPDMRIVLDIINDTWCQDRVEKIRETRR